MPTVPPTPTFDPPAQMLAVANSRVNAMVPGMIANRSGVAIVDFANGSTRVEVPITGLTSIKSTSNVSAWIQADRIDVTADVDAHLLAADLVKVVAGVPVDGVGFTLYALSEGQVLGQFLVRWRWS